MRSLHELAACEPGVAPSICPASLRTVKRMPPARDQSIFRRRRQFVALGLVGVLAVGGGVAWAVTQAVGGDETAAASSGGDTTNGLEREVPEATPGASAVADYSMYSPEVAAQLTYASRHWDETTSEQFGYLDENDCVNFASQTLLARGWAEDDEWWFDESGDPYAHADAWISSTAFMWYLEDHPERATPLTDDQRASVKVGDIVQFDWDDSGDRDHTGIVTSVETDDDGATRILYAGHTDPTWDRSVDYAITELHPGGIAYYWSITG
jgi:hypothetical protein